MKGIVLAGGKGTRLHPMTLSVSKQLMPIYDKPMIYYPLSTLIGAGIHDILIISTPEDLPLFKRLLGDGSQWGCCFCYAEQVEPKGLAEAFLIGESFINNAPVALILGDNLFHGSEMTRQLSNLGAIDGGHVFAYHVKDPERYGVVEFDQNNKAIGLEEKPQNPKSSYAVPGIYFYDATVVEKAKALAPSSRGELEITEINKAYLKEGKLHVTPLEAGSAWLDTGTIESLMEASQYVQALQSRRGILVGSPEVAAYNSQAISKNELFKLGEKMEKTTYGEAIKAVTRQ
ncbi:MAG: glucose-1-phosphate thymidylyltransferase RfbA [Flavobacteriaceae bacterium]